jgi:hypothetical protein
MENFMVWFGFDLFRRQDVGLNSPGRDIVSFEVLGFPLIALVAAERRACSSFHAKKDLHRYLTFEFHISKSLYYRGNFEAKVNVWPSHVLFFRFGCHVLRPTQVDRDLDRYVYLPLCFLFSITTTADSHAESLMHGRIVDGETQSVSRAGNAAVDDVSIKYSCYES